MSGILAAVDATKAKEVAKRFNIEGYPTGKKCHCIHGLAGKNLIKIIVVFHLSLVVVNKYLQVLY